MGAKFKSCAKIDGRKLGWAKIAGARKLRWIRYTKRFIVLNWRFFQVIEEGCLKGQTISRGQKINDTNSPAMESSPHFLILHVTVKPVVSGALESPGPAFEIPFEMVGSLSRRLPVSKKTSPTSWFSELAIFSNILIRSRPTNCEMSVVKMMEPVGEMNWIKVHLTSRLSDMVYTLLYRRIIVRGCSPKYLRLIRAMEVHEITFFTALI